MPVWNIFIDEQCVVLSEGDNSLSGVFSMGYFEIDDDCDISGEIFLVCNGLTILQYPINQYFLAYF